MAGIVFAKFTKPANRAETILFSKNALISMRNGSFYLLCRIADLRYSGKWSQYFTILYDGCRNLTITREKIISDQLI